MAIARGRRCTLGKLVIALAVTIGAMAPVLLAPPPASALPSCNSLPSAVLKDVCKGVAETNPATAPLAGVPNPVNAAAGVIGDAAKSEFQTFLQEFAQAEGGAVTSVLKAEMGFINKTTTPALTEQWFTTEYSLVGGMALLAMIFLGYFRLAQGAMYRDLTMIGNAFLSILLFLAVAGVFPALVAAVTKVVDTQLTPSILQISGAHLSASVNTLETSLTSSLSQGTALSAILTPLVILFFGVLGGVAAEAELLFREGMLYIVPLIDVWTLALVAAGRWGIEKFKNAMKLTAGVVLLKPIMAFLFLTSINIFGSGQGGSPALVGSVMCILVPVLSWHAYKRISGHDVQAMQLINTTTGHARRLANLISG